MKTTLLDFLKWDELDLIPVITQEASSGDVLMFAWMNRASLAATLECGYVVYWSRSRQKLWYKGEQSGHRQKVIELRCDCDQDVLLLKVEQTGGIACHTGRHSCFFYRYLQNSWQEVDAVLKDPSEIY